MMKVVTYRCHTCSSTSPSTSLISSTFPDFCWGVSWTTEKGFVCTWMCRGASSNTREEESANTSFNFTGTNSVQQRSAIHMISCVLCKCVRKLISRMYVCTRAHTHTHTHTHTLKNTHTHPYILTHSHSHTHTHTYIHTLTLTHTNTHIHTHTRYTTLQVYHWVPHRQTRSW